MYSQHPRYHHTGITPAEALGVITCLSIGLFGGCWLFGNDISTLLKIAAPPANSTASPDKIATSSPRVFEGELEQHLKKQVGVNAEPTENALAAPEFDSLPAATQPISESDVRALLGEPQHKTHRERKDATLSTKIASRSTSTSNHQQNESGEKTLAYWNAMNHVMAEEEAMRTPPTGGVTQENAADFIARRGQASAYAAAELRNLDTTGVDPAVVALNSEIAAWYAQGTQLNDRASYLLNEASDSTRKGQTGRNWGNSEKSHHASVAEINRRGDALRREMTQKYRLKFPDLR